MENKKQYHKSKYTILIHLHDGNFMFLHGYTGAIDIIKNDIVKAYLMERWEYICDETFQHMKNRGYITSKTANEEYEYVMNLANYLYNLKTRQRKCYTILVTYNCNFKCPYCFESQLRKGTNTISTTTFTRFMVNKMYQTIKMIEPDFENCSHVITLYGGEPFLKENKDIVTYIVHQGAQEGYTFHAITNGYDLDCFIDLIKEGYITKVQVTVDGYRNKHNEKRVHISNQNTFDKIVSNIILLLNQTEVEVAIRVNVDKRNISDFSNLKKFFEAQGIKVGKRLRMYASLIFDNDGLYGEGGKDIIHMNDHQLRNLDLPTNNAYDNIYQKIYKALKFKRPITFNTTYCECQSNGYIFSPFGEIFPCWEVVGRKEHIIGSYNSTLKWDEQVLSKWRIPAIKRFKQCEKCKYVLICGGRCIIHTECNKNYVLIYQASKEAYKYINNIN